MKESKLRKYKDEAAQYAEKGKYKQALSMYRDIVEAFPNDAATMLKIGDLCRKLKMDDAAISVYSNAAQHYASIGDLLKAIAVCKMILDIDAAHVQTQEILASLYTKKYGAEKGPGLSRPGFTVAPKQPIEEPPPAARVSEPPMPQSARVSIMPGHLTVDFTDAISDDSSDSESADEADEYLDVTAEEIVPEKTAEKAADVIEFDRSDGLGWGSLPPPSPTSVPEFRGTVTDLEESEPFDEMVCKIARPTLSPENLPKIPLFSSLDRESFVHLLSIVPVHSFEPFQTIVEEGDFGDSFYVIVSGSVEVRRNGVAIAMLDEGAFFGEMALVHPGPRNASVVTLETCQIMEVSNYQLNDLKATHPHVAATILQFTDERLLNNLMLTSPLFTAFSLEDQQSLIGMFETVEFVKDEVIIEKGQQPAGLYLIVLGSVSIYAEDAKGNLVHMAMLHESDIFGEISLLTRKPASAMVKAEEACRTLRLPRSRFNELIMTHPQVLELISAISDERVHALRMIQQPPLASTYRGGTALL